jgi:hypothetical protein
MSGRAAGLCAGYPNPGYATNPGHGRGRGIGRGSWGRGKRFWYRGYDDVPLHKPSTEEEKVYLENLVKNLEDEIKTLKDRIQDLSEVKKES